MENQNNQEPQQVMTLSEIANYLKVSEKTILRMAQGGDIPGAKISNQWRFMKTMIDDWFTMKMQATTKSDLAKVISTADKIVPVSKMITADRIILDLPQNAYRKEILTALVEPLKNSGLTTNATGFVEKLYERENMISTAIGHGIAVPHAREPEECGIKENCIVLGISPKGTDFNSLDGEKTYVFFLVCAMTDIMHLHLMAKVSMIMKNGNLVEKLCACKDKQKVIELLRETDMDIVIHN